MRRATRSLILVAALLACGDSTGPASLAGDYVLATVDGGNLPATIYADTGYLVKVTAGTLTLDNTGHYSATLEIHETVAGHLSVYADRTSGTWVREGAGIMFTNTADQSTWSATHAGRSLTVVETDGLNSWTFVYSR